MVSQTAVQLLEEAPVPGAPDRIQVTLLLRCGCRIREAIAADRILERPGGERVAVGKYRCPEGHPVS